MDKGEHSDEELEEHKATVRRMLQELSDGNVAGFIQNLTETYQRHCQAMPQGLQEIRGRDAMEGWLLANKATFPDYHEEIEDLVAEGSYVAWRSKGIGTQLGPLGPFPATGKSMSITIIGIHRFEGAQVAETWTSWDNLAALTQLGLLQR